MENNRLEEIFGKIRAFAFDVDGVLTDGGILANLDGELFRTFDSKDGMAFRMAAMAGYAVGIITGGRSLSIRQRFLTCGVRAEDIYLGSRAKIEDFDDFCRRHALDPSEVMYFGDDLPNIPVMLKCGCGVAPADSAAEVLEIADYVSPCPGGRRCAREGIEKVMRIQGKWHLDVDLYKAKF